MPVSLRSSDWRKILSLRKPRSVIHLAGCSFSEGRDKSNRNVDVELTNSLADESARLGVKRFIFISSILAVGQKSQLGMPLKPDSDVFPESFYGKSKLNAEESLRDISIKSGMELVIVRPPLVYGPGVKGNFRNLLRLIDRNIPIQSREFTSNLRSYISVSNLISFIVMCLQHPAAANQTFHVSDDDDISTSELLIRLGKALSKPVRNLYVPLPILRAGLNIIGKGGWIEKLCGDLRADISKAKSLLEWRPKTTMDIELEETVRWWREL